MRFFALILTICSLLILVGIFASYTYLADRVGNEATSAIIVPMLLFDLLSLSFSLYIFIHLTIKLKVLKNNLPL